MATVTDGETVNLFSGADGWGVAARGLGLNPLGFEHDADALATARAAGHRAWACDLAITDPDYVDVPVVAVIGSPPCQTFSAAGKRAGLADARGELVWVPRAWIDHHRPRWVAMEQVPEVLPIWRDYARWLTTLGYSTWCGLMRAERFGVPQTRTRAILIANRDRLVVPPEPTHQAYQPGIEQGNRHACRHDSLFDRPLLPWVSMAEALGLEPTEPQWQLRGGSVTGHQPTRRALEQPAPTLAFGNASRDWQLERPATTDTTDVVKLTVAQAAALQTFPINYPWQGSATSVFRQIGNAIPPLLAQHVLKAARSDAVESRRTPGQGREEHAHR